MIKGIANDIKEVDIKAVYISFKSQIFDKFDTNKDQSINLDEFKDKLVLKQEFQ